METKGTVRFNLKKNQKDSLGKVKIEMVYRFDGEKKVYSLPEKDSKLFPENWEKENKAPVGTQAIYKDAKTLKKENPDYSALPAHSFLTNSEIVTLNGRMIDLWKKVGEIEDEILRNGDKINVEDVTNKLRNSGGPVKVKGSGSKNAVTDILQRYIDEHKSERAPGSLAVYHTLKQNLADYQSDGNKVNFETVGEYDFFTKFRDYLLNKVGLVNSTVGKRISSLRGILKYAKTRHKVTGISEGFRDFKVTRGVGTIISLREEEFRKLLDLDLSKNKTYDNVRDAFCFSIATGYRRSDMNQLRADHIKDGEINLTVTKTRQTLSVPLNQYSRAIIKKHKGNDDPLPLISDQKSNQYIKEICKLAGFNDLTEIVQWKGNRKIVSSEPKYKVITNHVARKTFATLSLQWGMSAEVVMKIGGWKDYKSFQRYVDIADQRQKTAMAAAWDKPKPKPQKAPLKKKPVKK